MFWAAVLEHAQIHTLTEMGEEVDGWRKGRREREGERGRLKDGGISTDVYCSIVYSCTARSVQECRARPAVVHFYSDSLHFI